MKSGEYSIVDVKATAACVKSALGSHCQSIENTDKSWGK